MKVTGTQGIDPRTAVAEPTRSVAETKAPAAPPPQRDKVETSSPQIFRQAQDAQTTRRAEHVDTITQQVKAGTYTWPSAKLIAEQLLDAQSLTRHLRTLLG